MLVKNIYPIGTIIEFPEKTKIKQSNIPGCANIEIHVNGKLETATIIADYAKYMNEYVLVSSRKKNR